MGLLRLIQRQLRASLGAVFPLAAIIAIAGAAVTAVPGWLTSSLSSALETTIEESEADLRRSEWSAPTSETNEQALQDVFEQEPVLANAFTPDRWTTATREGNLDDNAYQLIDIRMPRSLTDNIEIVDGAMSSAEVDYDRSAVADGQPEVPTIEAVISEPVADMFELAIGDEVTIARGYSPTVEGSYGFSASVDRVTANITGIFRPTDENWSGWLDSYAAVEPFERPQQDGSVELHGAFLADPAVAEELTNATNKALFTEWVLTPGTAESLSTNGTEILEAIRRLEAQSDGWSTVMDDRLETHLAQHDGALRVTALGGASLAALLAIVCLLSVRVLAERTNSAVTLIRTRGGSIRWLGGQLFAAGLVLAIPPAAIGAVSGLAATGQSMSVWAMFAPIVVALFIGVSLPVIGISLARRGSTRPEQAGLRPSVRRLMSEIGLVLVAAMALWLLTDREASGSSVDPIVSFTPAIVAAAAGVVIFRGLPPLAAAATGWTRRGRGITAFISSARTSRSAGAAAIPVIAVLVAVALAALASSIDSTAERGRVTASWEAVPADVVVSDADQMAADQIAVPGADIVARGYVLPRSAGRTADDNSLRSAILAVELDQWEQIVERSPDPVPAVDALTRTDNTATVPAVLAGSGGRLNTGDDLSIGNTTLTVVDNISVFPGVPQSPTLVVPATAVDVSEVAPSVAFVGGTVDEAAVAEATGGHVETRAAALAEVDSSPMLQVTLDAYEVALYAAAALAGAAAVLSIAITGRSRLSALSMLRMQGLTSRQAAGVMLGETMPPIVVAAGAGVIFGNGVTLATANALDLAALTTTLGTDPSLVLNASDTSLAAAGVLGVVLAATAFTVLTTRRWLAAPSAS